jgi:subtilase family serine protease
LTLSGGISGSTPIFASIINRINEMRLNAGKNALGFLNPALYSNSEMFNDIVNGTNPGCGTHGFSAVLGWDPVTGLGRLMSSEFSGRELADGAFRNSKLPENGGVRHDLTIMSKIMREIQFH